MKITFLGVGAAFDEEHPNMSILVQADNQNLLLDCGYSVPPELWKLHPEPDFLDAVWISHEHADHCYGIAPLIKRISASKKRNKPLYIFTMAGMKEKLEKLIDGGYPGLMEKLNFDMKIIEVTNPTEFAGMIFSVAPTVHMVPNMALRIEAENKVLSYSGDGMFVDETKELYRGSDFLLQETFLIDKEEYGHANILELSKIMDELEIKQAAAAHLNNSVRRDKKAVLDFIKSTGKNIILPEEGDVIEI
ncbi:MBL fold metallo-hydrolase [Nanoarchaeota archaeon]